MSNHLVRSVGLFAQCFSVSSPFYLFVIAALLPCGTFMSVIFPVVHIAFQYVHTVLNLFRRYMATFVVFDFSKVIEESFSDISNMCGAGLLSVPSMRRLIWMRDISILGSVIFRQICSESSLSKSTS